MGKSVLGDAGHSERKALRPRGTVISSRPILVCLNSHHTTLTPKYNTHSTTQHIHTAILSHYTITYTPYQTPHVKMQHTQTTHSHTATHSYHSITYTPHQTQQAHHTYYKTHTTIHTTPTIPHQTHYMSH